MFLMTKKQLLKRRTFYKHILSFFLWQCPPTIQSLCHPDVLEFAVFFWSALWSSILICPMAHPPPNVPASSLTQWTLFHCAWWVMSLLFLHLSITLSLHTSLAFSIIITVEATEARRGGNRLQYKKAFLSQRIFLEPSLESQVLSSLLRRPTSHSCS